MKVILIIAVIVVAALIALVVLIGALLPRHHTASRSIAFRHRPEDVYAVIRDFESASRWRASVTRSELLSPVDGRIRLREHGRHGAVTYEVVDDNPGRRLVTRIVDQNLGYSGSWTYDLSPESGGSRLSITENGEVSNVVFRFMSRFVFGHTKTIDEYVRDLQEHLS